MKSWVREKNPHPISITKQWKSLLFIDPWLALTKLWWQRGWISDEALWASIKKSLAIFFPPTMLNEMRWVDDAALFVAWEVVKTTLWWELIVRYQHYTTESPKREKKIQRRLRRDVSVLKRLLNDLRDLWNLLASPGVHTNYEINIYSGEICFPCFHYALGMLKCRRVGVEKIIKRRKKGNSQREVLCDLNLMAN